MYIYLDIHTVITACLSEPPGKPHIYIDIDIDIDTVITAS